MTLTGDQVRADIADRLERLRAACAGNVNDMTVELLGSIEATMREQTEVLAGLVEMLAQYAPVLDQVRDRMERPMFGRRKA